MSPSLFEGKTEGGIRSLDQKIGRLELSTDHPTSAPSPEGITYPNHGFTTIAENFSDAPGTRADSFRATHRHRSARDDGKDRFHLRKHNLSPIP